MARDVRVDFTGDAGNLERASLEAAAALKGVEGAADKSNFKLRSFQKTMSESDKALAGVSRSWRDSERAMHDAGKTIDEAGRALGDISPSARTVERDSGRLASIFGTLAAGGGAMIPLFGQLGTVFAALPPLVIAATVAVAAFWPVLFAGVAILADLIGPVGVLVGLLGGLGAAFAYVTMQSFKNKASVQDQKDALLALHVAQQTYNQDLAKYGQSATQTESALLALHKAQDTYAQAQIGVAIGTAHLDDKFHSLVMTLSRDFAPEIVKLASSASTALSYLDKIAHLPLAQAFHSLATQGVAMLNRFVEGVAHVISRPVRLALQVAFGAGTQGMQSVVSHWWHQLMGFFFGYTQQHHIKIGAHVIELPASHVDGIFSPLVKWFDRHHFLKQGTRMGQQILAGFVASGASQKIGKLLVESFQVSGGLILAGMRHVWNEIQSYIFGKLTALNSRTKQVWVDAWNAVKAFALSVWSDITSKIGSDITAARSKIAGLSSAWGAVKAAALGVWNYIKGLFDRVLTVHINIPTPSIPSLPGLPFHIPHLASGGIVHRPTLALVGESTPEAVVPLHKMGSMGGELHVHIHSPMIIHRADLTREIQLAIVEGGRRGFKFAGPGGTG